MDRSMWHCKVWWAGVSPGSLATCPNSELRRRTIGSSTVVDAETGNFKSLLNFVDDNDAVVKQEASLFSMSFEIFSTVLWNII